MKEIDLEGVGWLCVAKKAVSLFPWSIESIEVCYDEFCKHYVRLRTFSGAEYDQLTSDAKHSELVREALCNWVYANKTVK